MESCLRRFQTNSSYSSDNIFLFLPGRKLELQKEPAIGRAHGNEMTAKWGHVENFAGFLFSHDIQCFFGWKMKPGIQTCFSGQWGDFWVMNGYIDCFSSPEQEAQKKCSSWILTALNLFVSLFHIILVSRLSWRWFGWNGFSEEVTDYQLKREQEQFMQHEAGDEMGGAWMGNQIPSKLPIKGLLEGFVRYYEVMITGETGILKGFIGGL